MTQVDSVLSRLSLALPERLRLVKGLAPEFRSKMEDTQEATIESIRAQHADLGTAITQDLMQTR